MRLDRALQRAIEQLNEVSNPRLDAETLLMHVLHVPRSYLHAHPESELTAAEQENYQTLIARRWAREPLQYITGHQEFWGIDFEVSPAVLIPRPETEHSVEAALALLKEIRKPRIADVGTGSGCIALALASERPDAEIYALDVSPEALEVARRNAQRQELRRKVVFIEGDLLQPLLNKRFLSSFDLIVSNPPYVPASEPETVQRDVRNYEPRIALFGGHSGEELYQQLIPQAHQLLKAQGWLVMEIGYSREAQTRALLKRWRNVKVHPDLQGIPRVVVAQPY